MCLRYQDKVTTVTKKDPAASLDEMVQTTTNTFYNREQEREAKSQDRERKKKKKKIRHAQMLATSREALWQTLSS